MKVFNDAFDLISGIILIVVSLIFQAHHGSDAHWFLGACVGLVAIGLTHKELTKELQVSNQVLQNQIDSLQSVNVQLTAEQAQLKRIQDLSQLFIR